MASCTRCEAPTDALCRLCDSCIGVDARASCEASGVPFKITDPVALEQFRLLITEPALQAERQAS